MKDNKSQKYNIYTNINISNNNSKMFFFFFQYSFKVLAYFSIYIYIPE